MWGANANTHGPKALQGVRQAGDTSTPLRQGDINFNAPNGTYQEENLNHHHNSELDLSDSDLDYDSEFDESESEQENESVANNNIGQSAHNAYAPPIFNIQGLNVDESNYNAIMAMSQLSTSMAHQQPGHGTSIALNALSQLSTQVADWQTAQSNGHGTQFALNALSQLTTSVAAHRQPAQSNGHGDYSAVNALSQMSTSVAHPVQYNPVQSNGHGPPVAVNALSHHIASAAVRQPAQTNGHANNSFSSGGQNARYRIAKNDAESDDDSENDDERNNAAKTDYKNSHNRMVPRTCNPIRPRNQICRREAGVDLFQMQRRGIEETYTTEESASASKISDITASLKRLKRRNFLKFSQLFQRNKSPSLSVTPTSTLPELLDSVGLSSCTESTQELEGQDQLQQIKTSEVLLMPPYNASIWMNTEDPMNLRPTSAYEKSIQEFLCFRSNFPDHFVDIRLLKLSIEEVQQIIRQVVHFENIQEKLGEIILQESLSGPALMLCDLIELKKSLNLNLGHWTIFEQLITGLRQIQNTELLKSTMQKQTTLDESMTGDPLQNVFEDVINNQKSNITSDLQSNSEVLQLIGENTK